MEDGARGHEGNRKDGKKKKKNLICFAIPFDALQLTDDNFTVYAIYYLH